MSDIAIEYRIKNARLKRAVLAVAPTYAAFCRMAGVGQSELSALLGMKESPLLKNGEWREVAWRISSATHKEPEDLWPEFLNRALEKRSGSVELTLDEAASIADARPRINKAILEDMRRHLTAREWEAVSRLVAGGETADEVGADWNRSRERVRQIAEKGLRKMRAQVGRQQLQYSDVVES